MKRVIWTPEMIRALWELRAQQVTLYRCAERIGVSYGVICRKAQELGIAGRSMAPNGSGRTSHGDRNLVSR